MKTISQHIEYAKGQPHHIRKRIAFAIAGIGTAIIALAWFIGSLSTSAFAIGGSTFADANNTDKIGTETSGNVGTGSPAAGVAGAEAALQDTNAPAHIEIIDSTPATFSASHAEQTTIPF